MERVFNIPRRITDRRRSKSRKIALAVWLSLKLAYGNSTLYGIKKDDIKSFFHCGDKKASEIIKAIWSDSELFYVNKRKNCVFAKCCKDKSVKVATNKRGIRYNSDDVITIGVPDAYSVRGEDKKVQGLPIKELLELIDCFLICKEYDKQTGYKSKTSGGNLKENCETEVDKSISFVAKKVGLSRTTMGRRVDNLITMHYVTKSEKIYKENSFMCCPSVLNLTEECPFKFRHIIWSHSRRLRAKTVGSAKNAIEHYFKYMHD